MSGLNLRSRPDERDMVLTSGIGGGCPTLHQIDLLGTEGNLAGKHGEGIYSVDGDILRICYTMPGQRRPKEFESPVNSKVYLVIWKRDQSFPES